MAANFRRLLIQEGVTVHRAVRAGTHKKGLRFPERSFGRGLAGSAEKQIRRQELPRRRLSFSPADISTQAGLFPPQPLRNLRLLRKRAGRGLRRLEVEAEEENAEAQFQLGRRNPGKAASWFRRAAANGHLEAAVAEAVLRARLHQYQKQPDWLDSPVSRRDDGSFRVTLDITRRNRRWKTAEGVGFGELSAVYWPKIATSTE